MPGKKSDKHMPPLGRSEAEANRSLFISEFVRPLNDKRYHTTRNLEIETCWMAFEMGNLQLLPRRGAATDYALPLWRDPLIERRNISITVLIDQVGPLMPQIWHFFYCRVGRRSLNEDADPRSLIVRLNPFNTDVPLAAGL